VFALLAFFVKVTTSSILSFVVFAAAKHRRAPSFLFVFSSRRPQILLV